MAGALERVLVCEPDDAGWENGDSWHALGYHRKPDLEMARSQHRELVSCLEQVGAEVLTLPRAQGLSLDAVYTHDSSFPTDHGMILMHPGKATRRGETGAHADFFATHDIPILGRIEPPGIMEGGDMVWLDASTLLVGEGYRTNDAAIAQLRELLRARGVEVIAAPLPYGPGPAECLHLMSLISILDDRAALVDLAWLSVPTVSLLESRGFDFVSIDPEERDRLACNVLALGGKRLLAIAENGRTNAKLEAAGFEVLTFPGSEICSNGSGGPTCLTRPLLRG